MQVAELAYSRPSCWCRTVWVTVDGVAQRTCSGAISRAITGLLPRSDFMVVRDSLKVTMPEPRLKANHLHGVLVLPRLHMAQSSKHQRDPLTDKRTRVRNQNNERTRI